MASFANSCFSRIPQGAWLTDESCGYSLFHLMAAQMLTRWQVGAFLEEASEQSANTLLDDMREHMTVFPSQCRRDWEENASYRNRWSWDSFRQSSAWQSPLSICLRIRQPLITTPVRWRDVHRVIVAAQVQSLRQIGAAIPLEISRCQR
jgi:hypothetical protein